MKKILFTLLIFVFAQNIFGQGINFQGVARSANGTILASSNISLRLSIISKNVDATPEYVETKTVVTNAQGIFSIVVGDATNAVVTGNFKNIAWKDGIKFLKVEMDPSAGTNYINMGATQLQYVPYSFYSLGVDAANVTGVLPIEKGGTGVGNLADLKTALKITNFDSTALSNRINTINSVLRQDSLLNVKVGIGSLQSIKSGSGNVAVGDSALKYTETGSYNTAVGSRSMLNTTTGTYNVAVGASTLELNTSGYRNVAIGNSTLVQNTTGYDNVAVGPLVMARNTTGRGNVGIGRRTLWRNSVGNNNLAIGDSTLLNIEGENNTAIGAYAGLKSETGSNNIFIGSKAAAGIAFKNVNNKLVIDNDSSNSPLIYGEFDNNKLTINGDLTATSFKIPNGTSAQYLKADGTVSTSVTAGVPYTGATQGVDLGAYDMKVNGISVGVGAGNASATASNIIVGRENLINNTTGTNNTAIGFESLKSNTTGFTNSAIGYQSLTNNISGTSNTALGSFSLKDNTTGRWNVAIGSLVLISNTTGQSNTAIGMNTLFNNTTGQSNTAVGKGALDLNNGNFNTAIGAGALVNNLNGNNNTAVGTGALTANLSGNNNTAIGYNASVYEDGVSSGTLSNTTAIGFNAKVTASNQIQLGDANVTDVKTSGVITSSGIRVGTNSPTISAAVEINSTTQGLLPPRMTQTQRDAILTPATGLVIFNSTSNSLEYKSSTSWVSLSVSSPSSEVFLPTIVIGNQQWMKENLDVMTYRNGDVIPHVTDATEWAGLTTGAWCWYNNDPLNGAIYGKLYNWYAVNDPRGLAPQGWHIPTDTEWTTLSILLGGASEAGGKMKTTGTTRWNTPNTNATNESGFAGLPGGSRNNETGAFSVGSTGYFWSATQDLSNTNLPAYYYGLYDFTGVLFRGVFIKKFGISVRCIRD
jgi:uncharacterized protein (TIGR02145 family)